MLSIRPARKAGVSSRGGKSQGSSKAKHLTVNLDPCGGMTFQSNEEQETK